jgi:D-tyrosyl-tRNA(Tyr) deacylase
LIARFAEMLRQAGVPRVAMGVFGARMQVEIHNDGPVTIWLDTDAQPPGEGAHAR